MTTWSGAVVRLVDGRAPRTIDQHARIYFAAVALVEKIGQVRLSQSLDFLAEWKELADALNEPPQPVATMPPADDRELPRG
jgi:hypothetical protein